MAAALTAAAIARTDTPDQPAHRPHYRVVLLINIPPLAPATAAPAARPTVVTSASVATTVILDVDVNVACGDRHETYYHKLAHFIMSCLR